MNNYKVYIHIFPNQKVYIGITKQKPEYRWRNGKKYNNNEYMTNAINKYGWENIEHIILYDNLTKQEAESKEKELIKKYKSNIREYGYNILDGGNVSNGMTEEGKQRMINKNKGKHRSLNTEFKKGHKPWTAGLKLSEEHRKILSEAHKGRTLNEETKRKLSEKFKGKNHPNYGKHISLEVKEKISASLKGKKGYWEGKHHTEETKNKISNSKKGTISPLRKKVLCIETNIIYDSITEVFKKTNINTSHISQVCRGTRKTAGGFHWKYILD